MKKITKLMLTSLVGLMSLSSAAVQNVAAQHGESVVDRRYTEASITFNVSEGPLSFVSASSSIDFGTHEFTYDTTEETAKKVDKVDGTFTIVLNDDRVGDALTWNLKASAASSEGGLPQGTTLTFSEGVLSSAYGYDTAYFPVEENVNPLSLTVGDEEGGVETVLSADRGANSNQGIGEWSLNYERDNILLTIGTAQKALMSDAATSEATYSTTITWTLSDGPS